MNYRYEFYTNFTEEIISMCKNKEEIDEWGLALITINNKYGVEYNLCFENGNNYSAIYFQECDENNIWQTDFTGSKHYEIDFNSPYWIIDLEKEMKEYLFSVLNKK